MYSRMTLRCSGTMRRLRAVRSTRRQCKRGLSWIVTTVRTRESLASSSTPLAPTSSPWAWSTTWTSTPEPWSKVNLLIRSCSSSIFRITISYRSHICWTHRSRWRRSSGIRIIRMCSLVVALTGRSLYGTSQPKTTWSTAARNRAARSLMLSATTRLSSCTWSTSATPWSSNHTKPSWPILHSSHRRSMLTRGHPAKENTRIWSLFPKTALLISGTQEMSTKTHWKEQWKRSGDHSWDWIFSSKMVRVSSDLVGFCCRKGRRRRRFGLSRTRVISSWSTGA